MKPTKKEDHVPDLLHAMVFVTNSFSGEIPETAPPSFDDDNFDCDEWWEWGE